MAPEKRFSSQENLQRGPKNLSRYFSPTGFSGAKARWGNVRWASVSKAKIEIAERNKVKEGVSRIRTYEEKGCCLLSGRERKLKSVLIINFIKNNRRRSKHQPNPYKIEII